MNEKIPITVLMPVYNGGRYLKEAIDSVLTQTYTNFEFLIVNDGSTDNSLAIIESYKDKRIRVINQANAGVSEALNSGLRQAEGKYIARFDADDICYPDRLNKQFLFMEHNPKYVLIGSDVDYVSQWGDFIFSYLNTGHSDEEIREKMYEKNPIIHSSVFFRKQVIIDAGGYDCKAHTFEDHLLWIKVIKHGRVLNFKEPLIKVRLNPESVTTDERLRGKRFLDLRLKILKENKPVSKEDSDTLMEIIKKQNSGKMKKLGYYHFVAKKYLWNNYQPILARRYAFQALKLKPIDTVSPVLLLLSFLPKRFVINFYRYIK